jgi:hypothetical protein
MYFIHFRGLKSPNKTYTIKNVYTYLYSNFLNSSILCSFVYDSAMKSGECTLLKTTILSCNQQKKKKKPVLHNESSAVQLSWHGNQNAFPCTIRPWNVPIMKFYKYEALYIPHNLHHQFQKSATFNSPHSETKWNTELRSQNSVYYLISWFTNKNLLKWISYIKSLSW